MTAHPFGTPDPSEEHAYSGTAGIRATNPQGSPVGHQAPASFASGTRLVRPTVSPDNFLMHGVRVEVPGAQLVRTYFIRETSLKPFGVWVKYESRRTGDTVLLKSYDSLDLALRHLRLLTRQDGADVDLVPRPQLTEAPASSRPRTRATSPQGTPVGRRSSEAPRGRNA